MFRDWFSSVVSVAQIAVLLINFGLGLDRLFMKKYTLALFYLTSGTILILMLILMLIFRIYGVRKRARTLAALCARDAALREVAAMSIEQKISAFDKAMVNLEKVAQATGATLTSASNGTEVYASLKSGRFEFVVWHGGIHRSDAIRGLDLGTTCFYSPAVMPFHEAIASALLQLKRDPAFFEKLYKQDGMYV